MQGSFPVRSCLFRHAGLFFRHGVFFFGTKCSSRPPNVISTPFSRRSPCLTLTLIRRCLPDLLLGAGFVLCVFFPDRLYRQIDGSCLQFDGSHFCSNSVFQINAEFSVIVVPPLGLCATLTLPFYQAPLGFCLFFAAKIFCAVC